MMTIYHGTRPFLPLFACYRHLGYTNRNDALLLVAKSWDWQNKPLYIVGWDESGGAVGCLVHGNYRGVYRRALEGLGSIVGLTVNWVDIDNLLQQQKQTNGVGFLVLTLANYFPETSFQYFHSIIYELVKKHFALQQEEQR